MGTTLTGTQINNTYDGLIKVTDNGPIGATPKLLTDGLGNDSKVAVGTLGTTFTGTVSFGGATVTGLPDNDTTYDLLSAQNGANAEILLVGSDSTTDIVTLVAGTNITLTDTGGSITIDAAGGGGGATPPMSIYDLPAMADSTFSVLESYRTWVPVNGYATTPAGTQNSNRAQLAVFAMGEGWPINKIFVGVSTAVAGATGRVAIYDLTTDANDNLVLGNKLRDVGTFSAATTGQKTLDISATPFIMPAGKDYGAVAIAVAADIDGVSFTAWQSSLWTGNGGGVSSGDWYRTLQWLVTAVGQNLGTAMPANLAAEDYDGQTNNPLWIGING